MPSVDEIDVPVYVKNEYHPERKTIKGATYNTIVDTIVIKPMVKEKIVSNDKIK